MQKLAQILYTEFTHDERQVLLRELGTSLGKITQNAKTAELEAWEIVDWFERRGQLARLRAAIVALRPTETAHVLDTQLSDLAERFKAFHDSPTPERIAAWLQQFTSGEPGAAAARRVRLAKQILHEVKFYDHANVTRRFKSLHARLSPDEYGRISYTAMGGQSDSSVLHTYYLAHVAPGLSARQFGDLESLANLPRSEQPDTIVFIDDVVGSGTQAIGILRNWLGLAHDPEYPVQLSDAARQLLKSRRLVYNVCIGMRQGIDRLKQFAREEKLSIEINPVELADDDFGCFDTAYKVFDSQEDREAARAMAYDIGYALLADRPDWGEEKRRQRALGYGSSAKLIVFPYNTPTCTLTMLWKGGTYRGATWQPLFRRR